MFEKLFVKTSDLVFHKIAPYAVERERFLAHCCEEGFSQPALRRIAGIVVTAAYDLHAHGGLDVDQERLEAAAGRIEMTRRQAGVRYDAREYRREFLRVTTRPPLAMVGGATPRPTRRLSASSKFSRRRSTTKAIWTCRKRSSMGASRPPSREGPAWARRSAARGRRSWPSRIVRGSRLPSTSRVPRRMKSDWCRPRSRTGLSGSSRRVSSATTPTNRTDWMQSWRAEAWS